MNIAGDEAWAKGIQNNCNGHWGAFQRICVQK